MSELNMEDGIQQMVPKEKMSNAARKLRDFYEIKPDAPLCQQEFGYYSLDRWKSEEKINDSTDLDKLFEFDKCGGSAFCGLGWTEAAFQPQFEEKFIEDRGEHEVIQDTAGRYVLFFKGRRNGFMPEYLDHPVKDMKTWEENCKWRLDPKNPERYSSLPEIIQNNKLSANEGKIITQWCIGGYMYLRSLIGPLDLLYKFYDEPDLIHDCMKTWLDLADEMTSKIQKEITFDEFFIGEDICYNHGPLISPDMIHEFLFPYYQQLLSNIKSRQIDKNRHLYFQVDTDGHSESVIDLYKEIGMDYMSPFEVASGSDVVAIGRKYPDLIMRGGIDKRVLAKSKDDIDRYLDGILPIMRKRGGYIPTCDHGVPEEVSFENYMHYRKRMLEYSK